MTCKVRRDFKIITDVSSRVSLVTSSIRGSPICSLKSLYKKTSNEILAELKEVVKTGALKVPEAPTRHTPVCYELSAVKGVCQTASSLTHTLRHHREERIRRNFSSCSDHSWIKTTALFSSLIWVFLFLRTSFFTAQNVGPMVHMFTIAVTISLILFLSHKKIDSNTISMSLKSPSHYRIYPTPSSILLPQLSYHWIYLIHD